MSLHPVLADKLSDALAPAAVGPFTGRDAHLPPVPGKVHAVIGMRRAGKTTFLRQLLAERRQVLPLERAVYLSFDDDRLSGLELDQLGFLLEEYYRRHPALRGRETVHWFLDQIQLVAGWECFVRRALDSEKVEIAVLGSSARMLSREVHTSLRGRGRATVIRPFPGATSGQAQPGEPADPAAAILAAHRKIDEGDKRASMTPPRYDRIDGTRCTSSSTAPVGNRARKPRGSCQIE